MKQIIIKTLSLFILIFSLNSIAQSKYIIEKQLQLNNVIQGCSADSVLVRGTDKVIKYVPRSEFASSAPDLQAVLDAGAYAEFDAGNSYLDLFNNSGRNRYIRWGLLGGASNWSALYSDQELFNIENKFGDNISKVVIDHGVMELSQIHATDTSIVLFQEPIASTNIFFPAKSAGDYTLATTADIGGINLQEVLDNGNNASTSILLESGADIFLKGGGRVIAGDDEFLSNNIRLDGAGASLEFNKNSVGRSAKLSANNIDALRYFELPNGGQVDGAETRSTIPLAVNGNYADPQGNIYVNTAQTLDNVLSNGNTSGNTITLGNFTETAQTILNPGFIEQIDNGQTTKIIGNRIYGNSESYNNVNLLDLKRQTEGNITYYFAERATGSYPLATVQNFAPSSATDTGVLGEIRVAGGYIYWCVAANTWLRAEGTTF